MADQPNKLKPRPVDALFGDAPGPTFIVDAPQPVTTVTPPPLEDLPAPAPLASFTPPPAPASVSPESFFAPMPASAATRRALTPDDEKFFIALPGAIRQLYNDIETQLTDSASIAVECMKMLRQARAAYQSGDFASAEFFVASVRAKIRVSARSASASRRLVVWILWLWQLGMLGFAVYAVAITFIAYLTIFGILINPTFTVPLRAIGWGVIGGVIGALYAMLRTIQRREYDPAGEPGFFARPVLGGLIGAVLFLLSQAGILAGGGASPEIKPDEIPVGPVLLNLFAAFAGFKQEYVFEFFDNLLRSIFRLDKPARPEPQAPKDLPE